MSLKILTVNIEGHRHVNRWPRLIQEENPDVVCMQEVFVKDLDFICEQLDMEGAFFPIMTIVEPNIYGIDPFGLWGVGLFTKLKHTPVAAQYYVGSQNVAKFEKPNDASRVLLTSTVEKDGVSFVVGTTHFTWSGEGKTTPEQLADFAQLKKILATFPELILCGDFNAPRGRELFSKFTEVFQDTLPPEVTTTLDENLHYAGKLELVVDTIFTTSSYQAKNVHTLSGVSDHMAVVGEVDRV